MVCTFGDLSDVVWWRELQLPTRAIIGRDGRVLPDAPPGVPAGPYAELAGRTIVSAQQRMVELLRESGDLQGEPKPITHAVKFFEKGDRPLGIVTTRQWYIRNGGRDPGLRQALIPRPGDHLGTGAHALPLRELGRGTQRRLAGQPAAVLRRPVPGLVPAGLRGCTGLRRADRRGRGRAAR
jgi:valyl-tRNA synthetase